MAVDALDGLPGRHRLVPLLTGDEAKVLKPKENALPLPDGEAMGQGRKRDRGRIRK